MYACSLNYFYEENGMKTVKQQTQYSIAYNIHQPEFKCNNM